MATILPLVAVGRRRSAPPVPQDVDQKAPVVAWGDELARAIDLLHRRAGDAAADLPVSLGRAALRAEALLARSPTALDASSVEPAAAVTTAERVLKAASAIVDLMEEEARVLGEALSSDLGSLGLGELLEVAEAVLGIGVAPRAVPEWGTPAAAVQAEIVLRTAGDDLRVAACSHARVYGRFTEGVWDVPGAHLQSGQRRWRLIARARLRRELRAVSRTGRVPGRLTAVAREVLDALAARERRASLAPLLSHHLGELDHGPLSDVDAAMAAVGAVRRLQAALGDQLDDDRLQLLLRADAFDSYDVAGPAANLRNAVRAWAGDVESAGGDDALGLSLAELAEWAAEGAGLVPALIEGQGTFVRLGVSAPTLRFLVDTLVVRERVQDLLADGQRFDKPGRAWSAS